MAVYAQRDIKGARHSSNTGEIKMFGRKTIAIGNEPKMTLKVGHDRYNNLIIKELRVSGDSIDEVISQLKQSLEEFNQMKGEILLAE
tara:strand:+ start:7871 stop:8131 length:261 start_codon:yes stop_codon:yes gene_type:complete